MKVVLMDKRPRAWGRPDHLIRGALVPLILSAAFVVYVVLGELGVWVGRTDRFYVPFIVAFVVVQAHMAFGFLYLAAVAAGRVPGILAFVTRSRTVSVQWGPLPKLQVHGLQHGAARVRHQSWGHAGAWLIEAAGNPTIAVPFLDATRVSDADIVRLQGDVARLFAAQRDVAPHPVRTTGAN